MNNAYVIGHITVKDPERWSDYRRQVPATLKPWGAQLVCRGRLVSILAGDHDYTDTVVIRFPDIRAVNGWYASPAYQALIPLREKAAELILLAYEG